MGQQLLAGACAGTVALVVCYPMDVVRTRMMVQGGERLFQAGVLGTARLIAQQDGLATFYRGFSTAVIAVVPSNAVFYAAYDALRQRHLRRQALVRHCDEDGQKWGLSLRRKGEPAARAKARKGRASGSSSAESPNTEGVRKVVRGSTELGALYTLLYGALAGAIAEATVFPLETVRRQLQHLSESTAAGPALAQPGRSARVVVGRSLVRARKVTAIILEREGVRGLYRGVLPSTLQVLPSAAISYFLYQKLKASMGVRG